MKIEAVDAMSQLVGVNQNTGGDYTTGDSGVIVPIILLVGISLLIMSLLMAK